VQDVLSWSHLPTVVAVGAVLLMLFLKFQRSSTSEVRLKSAASLKPRSGWPLEAFHWRRSPKLSARFECMDEADFEAEVSELLRDLGYTVRPTPPSSIHDVDLLLEMTSHRVAVQLKRWNAPVGNRSVYAAFVGRIHYGTDEAWLITTSRFTSKAVKLARTTGVRLVDGGELAEWLEDQRQEGRSSPFRKLDGNLVETVSTRKHKNLRTGEEL
jgi:Restriction endonuclease